MKEDLSGLDLMGLLERLEPVREPTLIAMWPQTQAWAWLGIVLLLGVLWGGRRVLQRRRANAYRRAALAEIAAADGSAVRLAEILRRTALAAYPRTAVAGLHGEEWLAFLDRTGRLARSGPGNDFREGPGRVILRAPYVRDGSTDARDAALVGLAVRWVRHHRTGVEGLA